MRYHSFDSIGSLPLDDGIAIINHAMDKINEDRLYMRWIPYQSECSFDDFKKSLVQSVVIPKSEKQVMSDVNDIISAMNRGDFVKDGNI